jgi:Helicase HerA-like C-terminal
MSAGPSASDFSAAIAAASTATGPSVDLGRGVLGGTLVPEAKVTVPLSMMNRHGLVAGATGTGKTKTLQVLAEQLSAVGVLPRRASRRRRPCHRRSRRPVRSRAAAPRAAASRRSGTF